MFLKLIDMAIAGYQGQGDPADYERLQFFRQVWGVQDRLIAKAGRPDYDMPSPQALRAWNQEAESVLSHKPVPIDADALVSACKEIANCIILQDALGTEVNQALSQAEWETLLESADMSLAGKDPAAFVAAVADVAQDQFSEDLSVTVAMVASMALRTQLETVAADIYKAMLSAAADVPRPVKCPVCGGQATLARVGLTRSKNGRAKELWCSQCGTAWEFERVRCGRCGTQNQNHIHYFSLEGDDSHRIQNCDECGNYVRTLYQDEAVSAFSYEVEDVVMAKLDQVAFEQAKAQAE